MRTLHGAIRAVESYSPAEEAFNRKRRTWGLFLGPLVFALSAFAFIVIPAAAVAGIAALTGTSLLRPPLGPAAPRQADNLAAGSVRCRTVNYNS